MKDKICDAILNSLVVTIFGGLIGSCVYCAVWALQRPIRDYASVSMFGICGALAVMLTVLLFSILFDETPSKNQ